MEKPDKNLVEKLKDNKKAWMFLSKEERECLIEANEQGAVETLTFMGDWKSGSWSELHMSGQNEIWRIIPDYQPKPEPKPDQDRQNNRAALSTKPIPILDSMPEERKMRTEMDLIEKLKDKDYVRAFGLMSGEAKACFRKVGKKNCLFLSDMTKDWIQAPENDDFCWGVTYAIKPDYKPKPESEFVYLEIQRHAEGIENQTWWLGVWAAERVDLPHLFTHLHCLSSLPNFAGFWYDNPREIVLFEYVAAFIREGKKVYARLRTSK